MEDVKALEQIGRLTSRFTRTCPSQPEYQERLAEEFEIILSLRFTDYFCQIRDILDLTQDIPHMTRGSAGSSLVCYLMGITDVILSNGTFLWHVFLTLSEMTYLMLILTIRITDKKKL